MEKEITVALVGNPNCGKTSLFNALTGLNHKVSNFAGTTVEKKTGETRLSAGVKAQIIDLPGTYSLYPKSADELVTYEILRNKAESNYPDLVIFIADASNLKRNLLLYSQVADLGVPIILCLNMMDVAERKGIRYDLKLLEKELGVPIFSINARKQEGIDNIKSALLNDKLRLTAQYYNLDHVNAQMLDEVCKATDKRNKYAALQFAINASSLLSEKAHRIIQIFEKYSFDTRKFQEEEILARYQIIDGTVRNARLKNTGQLKNSLTHKIDEILTHRYWGIAIFLVLLLLVFQAMFSWSSYPMDFVEYIFGLLSNYIETQMPKGILNDLLVQGILAGLSGVMIFLPQIIILFLFIAILEDIGYMARVGFMMDRIMRPFGMNGKSIVPLISGMACAVPSIMASRNIENKKERLITILVTPLMSCSARLPVYTLLIGMLIPDTAKWGPFNVHGLVLMVMYLIGFAAAILSAWIFKFFIKQKQKNYFIMELPSYKMPVFSNLMITLYEKTGAFVWGAGKIIVAVSVVLWVLASTGPQDNIAKVERKFLPTISNDTLPKYIREEAKLQMNAQKLEASYAGEFGKMIEPTIRPLGFDWKIGIALLTSLAAREVFVGTMSTIYSVNDEGGEETFSNIKTKMQAEINSQTGKPSYSLATILSLMIFYAFALQCMSTIAVVKKETHSNKWPIIQFLYMTVLAYASSFFVFTIFS
ncbi:MAG: ferrous iron transport protein B [Bacteroidetes bacterium]|nr:ferrous iron transport protein B [Bacteroidota bacterium]